MKKRWIWIILIALVVFLVVGYLYSQGKIHTNWQWLSIILAAAAGPFEFIRKLFSGDTITAKKLAENQKRRQTLERQHRVIYDRIIKKKEQRIRELEAQVERLSDQLDRLKLEMEGVHKEVENMDTPEIQEEFIKYYGE